MLKRTLDPFLHYSGSRAMSSASSAAIRPSATIIVAAPTPPSECSSSDPHKANYRLLMMKRNALSSFVNAHVFPGGVVDVHDNASHWQSHLGQTKESADILTHKICAIRETFEESGLLLTYPPAYSLPDLDLEKWRHRVHHEASQFKVMCETFNLTPAVDKLVPFASWITPTMEKKRYNTKFFLTVLEQTLGNEEQGAVAVSADGKETLQLDWFQPKEALDQWRQKQIVLFPPQWYCLHAMQAVADHRDLQKDAGVGAFRTRHGEVLTILPQMYDTPSDDAMTEKGYRRYIAYPGDQSYHDAGTGTPPGQPGQRHRVYFKGRMEEFSVIRNVDVSDLPGARL